MYIDICILESEGIMAEKERQLTEKKLTDKGERVREKMVVVTAQILREEGFKKTTVRRICKEANVNIAAIRYYFGSKEELIGLALEYMMGNLETIAQTLEDTRLSPRERLKAYILAYFALAEKHPALFRSITRPSSDAAQDTYFVYLTFLYDQIWTKFLHIVGELSGLTDERDIELKSIQLLAAIEFPLILDGNKAGFFLPCTASEASLSRYIDLLIDGIEK